MRLYIRYDINTVGKKLLQEHLDRLEIDYSLTGLGEVEFGDSITADQLKDLISELNKYGIEIVDNEREILIQKIKDAIIEMVYMDNKLPRNLNTSSYLAEKLKYSYGYLSNFFSNSAYMSIENFIKLQKTERAKQLMITSDLTCSEIAWKLNYSSVAHFSSQFKNVTGLSPTAFQQIIRKRRELMNVSQHIKTIDN